MPTVTIDGIKVEVESDSTILDAAKQAGVWIPTLCFHSALAPAAMCRLCLVELDRGDWRQMVTACNYPVRRDIAVYVSSERAARARRGVMQLLLARAPESEPLRALAKQMGVEGTPYPTVTKSDSDCILCGLCTAVCEEVMGRSAIGFAGRGPERAVAAPFHEASEECIGCGACAAVCPVGSIRVHTHPDTGEIEISPFKTRVKLLRCESCGEEMLSVLATQEVLNRAGLNLAELKERVKLCPGCRRKVLIETLPPTIGEKK